MNHYVGIFYSGMAKTEGGILMLMLVGLHEKRAVQRGPTRHLYLDRRKPPKTLGEFADCRTLRMHTVYSSMRTVVAVLMFAVASLQ
jgi:hypothetical protein